MNIKIVVIGSLYVSISITIICMYFYIIDILCHQFNVNQLNACLLLLFYISYMTLYMYSAYEKQFKVWIESNRSLCCHVTTLSWRQASQSPPPPVMKMRVPDFCGRLGVWNRTAPDRRHLLPVATTKLIMRCVYKLNFRCTLSFPMKITSSTQLWYICASAGRYVFRWDRLLDEGLSFVQAGVPSCLDDVTLRSCTREFQMWRRRCKQIDPHWFQGRQMRFWWMLSTISWK